VPLLSDFGSGFGYGTTANIEAVLEEVSKLLIAYASAIESNH
jgi:hypothetical protein